MSEEQANNTMGEDIAAKELIRQQKSKIAQFKRKWRERDYHGLNAGKSIISYGIFATMQEWAEIKEPQPLFTDGELAFIKSLAETRQDRALYMGYAHLAEWITINLSAATYQLQLFTGAIMELDTILTKVIREEKLKYSLTTEDKKRLDPFLTRMGIDYMGIQSETEFTDQYLIMTNRIIKAKRYIKAYDTAIDLLAKAADIKELEIYKIRSSYIGNPKNKVISTAITTVNETIDTLKNMVIDRAEYQDAYHKDIIVRYLQPIDIEAEPIPPTNIRAVRDMIPLLKIFTTEANMGLIMITLGHNYWRE